MTRNVAGMFAPTRPADGVLLKVRDLKAQFTARRAGLFGAQRFVKAVDGVSFDIPRGTTLGLVGESGCGKTTLARTILRLTPAAGGGVLFDGVDWLALDRAGLRAMRRHLQVIFQDPVGSLNPRMSVGAIVSEPLAIHRVANRRERASRTAALLERVGLSSSDVNRYPHEFSGGQRQRIGIARAIALQPKLVICDEPVSALDVSIQSQILNLLADLRTEFGLSYLFIAHNLAVVRHFCDHVAVMYLGKIVEIGSAKNIYEHPRHPYTQALLASAPVADPTRRGRNALLVGEPPSPIDPPTGCAFHPRCPFATEHCRMSPPALECKDGDAGDHLVACHYADQNLSFVNAVSAKGGTEQQGMLGRD